MRRAPVIGVVWKSNAAMGGPIGCIKTPFDPSQAPLSASGWTPPEVTVKLHGGKGLAGRHGKLLVA